MNAITQTDLAGDVYEIRYLTSSGLHTHGPKCKSWACAVLSISVLEGATVDAIVINGNPQPLAEPLSGRQYRQQHQAQARCDLGAASGLQIYSVGDCEYWIGSSADAVLDALVVEWGQARHHIVDSYGEPVLLTDTALNEHRFQDSDENGDLLGTSRTFGEQLGIEVGAGGEFPRMLAAEDF